MESGMAKPDLREIIAQRVFLLDGGMGSQLIARGVEVGRCNELLNVESPDVISQIHSDYLRAGSDAVITNTFGANRYSLKRHGLSDRVGELNKAGAQVARQAAGAERYVLGDMGPSGEFLAPLGTLEPEALTEAFAEQAQALLDGGADGLIIETMTALDEMEVAIRAARSVGDDVPVLASMSFDKAGGRFRTMMGVSPERAAEKILSLGVTAVGFNCGTAALDEYVELAELFARAVSSISREAVVYAEPNAGKPELVDGQAVYTVGPDDFGEAASKINLAGISVIGGCCGTTPAHIKAVADRLKS